MGDIDKKFDLQHQWSLYLKRVSIKEEDLPEDQRREMKRVFYGCAGQMLLMLRDDIGQLEQDEAVDVLEDLIKQVSVFFLNQETKLN